MRLPKLKYYYLALRSDNYYKFKDTREIRVSSEITIDPETMEAQGQTYLTLTARPTLAEKIFRARHSWKFPVYVLRIAAADIDRRSLTATDMPDVFEYRAGLRIEHCGVERFESEEIESSQNRSGTITLTV